MKIKMLFAQRKCSYNGEFAPELLLAVDEFCHDENPDYFSEEGEKQIRAMGDACESHGVIEVDIAGVDIAKVLKPQVARATISSS